MNKVWTNKMINRLKREYPTVNNPRNLAKAMGITHSALKSKANILKVYRAAHATGLSKATAKEIKFLKENYLAMPVKRMATRLGRSHTFVQLRLKALGLVVPREIIEKWITESRIKKGDAPPNKGRKMAEYMSAAAIRASKKTRFKKHHLPHNTRYDGCVTIRTDNRGVKYKFIRCSKNNWIPLQRYIWEQKKGPIPKGGKIVFKDKNPMNLKISNLKLVTSKQLMKLNSLHNYPKPVAELIQLRGALNRQINKRLKQTA
jgi:hypothetical protein